MKGSVIDFYIQKNQGHILGDDGNSYIFLGKDWKETSFPVKEVDVNFDIDSKGYAINVSLYKFNQEITDLGLDKESNTSLSDIEINSKIMKGVILDFSIQKNKGYILGSNGNRYIFSGSDWREEGLPIKESKVSFKVDSNYNLIELSLLKENQEVELSPEEVEHASMLNKEENYNQFEWVLKCFKQCIDFSGRARCKEFWYFQLFKFLVGYTIFLYIRFILDADDYTMNLLGKTSQLFLFCIFFIPDLAVTMRRFHDTGKSGWWSLLTLVGYLYILFGDNESLLPLVSLILIVSTIILIVCCCIDTVPQKNQWGFPAKKCNE